ncbi:uncharacterized protein LOC143865558 [Tasmannia lanceolata]|uniref:uncharacterized protein LOC143865558 n=1 Tax=Tasmannia lanceolata TaxID=3420 RepID=UPI004064B6CE
MDSIVPRETDISIDLENGGTTSDEEGPKDTISNVKRTKKLLGRVWSGFVSFDGSVKGEDTINTSATLSDSHEVSIASVPLLTDQQLGLEENASLVEKDIRKEKPKKKKKAPKPPRPPKSPQLDAADQKLVREINELAVLKRARTERMKALKKMKAGKAASPSSNLCAMIITIIFCLVIILQGVFSRSNSHANFLGLGSPRSTEATREGLISVQYHKNTSARGRGPGSGSPNMVEQVSGLGGDKDESRVAG